MDRPKLDFTHKLRWQVESGFHLPSLLVFRLSVKVASLLETRSSVAKPKKSPTCEHCSALRKEFPIRSPDDLTHAIRQAQGYVASGALIELPFPREGGGRFPLIVETKAEGPWDDIMGFNFRCSFCDSRYYLGAETYHGSGGWWGPARDE